MSNSLQGARMERNVIPFDPREQPVLPSDPAPPEHLMTPESIARAKAAQAAERLRIIAQVRKEQADSGHLLKEQLRDSELRERIAQILCDADYAERGMPTRPTLQEIAPSEAHVLRTAAAMAVRYRRTVYQRGVLGKVEEAIALKLDELASHLLLTPLRLVLEKALAGAVLAAVKGVLASERYPLTPTEYAACTLDVFRKD